MHILDKAKEEWIEVCPQCQALVKADQLTVIDNRKALLYFKHGCGWRYIKTIELETAVDHIE